MDGTYARGELKQGCKGILTFHKLRVTHRRGFPAPLCIRSELDCRKTPTKDTGDSRPASTPKSQGEEIKDKMVRRWNARRA
jgi:hypothetical protein